MPGYPLTESTAMMCMHGGVVTLAPSQTAVTVQGGLVGTADDLLTVTGCLFTLPNGQPSPCVLVQWQGLSTQVRINGVPVQLQAGGPGTGQGQGIAATQNPQGPPTVTVVQLVAQGE
ncbi:MAG TPA: hypothetical protein VGN81_33340 [Pseudonocardiaceae bacterium]|jgi:hypothetical protein